MNTKATEEDFLPDEKAARIAAHIEDVIRDNTFEDSVEQKTLGQEFQKRASTLKLLNAAFGKIQADQQADAELPMAQIGKFELIRRIGAGGFGDVYLAVDPDLQREVALKVPRLGFKLDTTLRKRFQREQIAASKLQHPNIVQVLEAGEHEGLLFIAMEYCDGPNLAEWIRSDEPSEPMIAVRIVQQLAGALEHLHEQGVLHRDIKPSNILLQKNTSLDGLPFLPRLTDFGLAKNAEDLTNFTQSGATLGTLKYASPEQLRGSSELNEATDIYSLGIVLYELLTGKTPFESIQGQIGLQDALNNNIVRPSNFDPAVSPELDALCLKCLEKLPEERYSSVSQLRNDLAGVIDGRPISVRLPNRFSRLVRIASRNRILSTIITSVIMLLLGITVWQILPRDERAGALILDGIDDHMVASFSYDASHPITVEAWVYREGNSSTQKLLQIAGILDLSLQEYEPVVGALLETEAYRLHGDQILTPNSWTHIAGVYNGQHLSLFIDGHRQLGVLRYDPNISSEVPQIQELNENYPSFKLKTLWPGMTFAVGANPGATDYFSPFHGRIDEIRISDTVRYTEDFIPQDRFVTDSQTMALYHFDDLKDDVVTDDSGHGRHGLVARVRAPLPEEDGED
ncbi:MAG: protein kinase [Planctomycetota bacterium]